MVFVSGTRCIVHGAVGEGRLRVGSFCGHTKSGVISPSSRERAEKWWELSGIIYYPAISGESPVGGGGVHLSLTSSTYRTLQRKTI